MRVDNEFKINYKNISRKNQLFKYDIATRADRCPLESEIQKPFEQGTTKWRENFKCTFLCMCSAASEVKRIPRVKSEGENLISNSS